MSINEYPQLWNWSHEAHPRRLSEWMKAPDTNGFYEIGYMSGSFSAMGFSRVDALHNWAP